MQISLEEFNGIRPTDLIEIRGLHNKRLRVEVEHITRDRAGRIVLLCRKYREHKQIIIRPERVKKIIPTIKWS